MDEHNNSLYLDKETSRDIMTALRIAYLLILSVCNQKGCKNCRLLQKLSNIRNRLKFQKKGDLIHIDRVKEISPLFEENVECDSEICRNVWQMLKLLFSKFYLASEIIGYLEQIYRELYAKSLKGEN